MLISISRRENPAYDIHKATYLEQYRILTMTLRLFALSVARIAVIQILRRL